MKIKVLTFTICEAYHHFVDEALLKVGHAQII